MTTFNWTISQMERNTADGFVTTVHYCVSATDSETTVGTYGTVGFEAGTPATPFESLTEEQVIGWVQAKLDKDVVEAALQAQIDAQNNPVTATGMPWSQTSQGA